MSALSLHIESTDSMIEKKVFEKNTKLPSNAHIPY